MRFDMYEKIVKEMVGSDAGMQIWWNKIAVDAISDMAKETEEKATRRQKKPETVQEVEGLSVEELTPNKPEPKKKPKKKKARKPKPGAPKKRDKWEAVKV
jgi:outer membrane biosynthesis protein TonB